MFGNAIDFFFVRQGQDGQTIGIPVGPDTSRIISELILKLIDVPRGLGTLSGRLRGVGATDLPRNIRVVRRGILRYDENYIDDLGGAYPELNVLSRLSRRAFRDDVEIEDLEL